MKFVFGIFFIAMGIWVFWFAPKMLEPEKIDYSKCKKASAKFIGIYNDAFHHYIVEFTDEDGNEVLGADHISGKARKIMLEETEEEHPGYPVVNRTYEICYWDWDVVSRYQRDHKEVKYWTHFMDESVYDEDKKDLKKQFLMHRVSGTLWVIIGILILVLA